MGQILHGSATTTHGIRAAIQRSKAPLKELAAQYGLNTVSLRPEIAGGKTSKKPFKRYPNRLLLHRHRRGWYRGGEARKLYHFVAIDRIEQPSLDDSVLGGT